MSIVHTYQNSGAAIILLKGTVQRNPTGVKSGMKKKTLSIDTTFNPFLFSLDHNFKGTVRRKLMWVKTGINQ